MTDLRSICRVSTLLAMWMSWLGSCWIVDALWLLAARVRVPSYRWGRRQGESDSILLAIGLGVVLQSWKDMRMPTHVLQGFELVWRNAVKYQQVGQTGFGGRMWPFADAALGDEKVRVRWGPLLVQYRYSHFLSLV